MNVCLDEAKGLTSQIVPNVVYQVYPRSFKDSNGDGIGDIPGIIEKLDYLQELGIDVIWFNPFFKSPQKDYGYDVTDFCDIAPEYGTMKDFDRLLKEMHRRKMKVILDFVLNHTSIEHPWFKESALSRSNPKRDWYIWRDGKKPGGRKPPNNWKAMTGGPAWRYFENTDQWVYFHFLPFEIDLNYRNPEVKETMLNIMRFWLDKGVDGFRLDVMHAIYEDEELRDNPLSWRLFPSDKSTAVLFNSHKYDLNLPETIDFARELREVVDEYKPGRLLIGEVFGCVEDLCDYCGPEGSGLNMVFLFEFASTAFKPKSYAKIINRIEKAFPPPYMPVYVFSNHDRMRLITRLNSNIGRAKIAATMQMTLRGVPFIYYGEEIGMPNSSFPLKTSLDPLGRKYAWLPFSQFKRLGFSLTRDGCRTPMQWTDEPNSGFCPPNVKPWLKISETHNDINVAKQRQDPNSLLNCYQRLIELRSRCSALLKGRFEFIELGKLGRKCLAYRRIYGKEEVHVYLNFSSKSLVIKCPSEVAAATLLFSTSVKRTNLFNEMGRLSLGPFEGIIFRMA
jgi:glycosidase